MKILCLVAVLIAFLLFSVSAEVSLHQASQVTQVNKFTDIKDVLAFLEGFALGIESGIGNITTCTNDVQMTLEDFQYTVKLMEDGIHFIYLLLTFDRIQ
jgi:hypothetical protein